MFEILATACFASQLTVSGVTGCQQVHVGSFATIQDCEPSSSKEIGVVLPDGRKVYWALCVSTAPRRYGQ